MFMLNLFLTIVKDIEDLTFIIFMLAYFWLTLDKFVLPLPFNTLCLSHCHNLVLNYSINQCALAVGDMFFFITGKKISTNFNILRTLVYFSLFISLHEVSDKSHFFAQLKNNVTFIFNVCFVVYIDSKHILFSIHDQIFKLFCNFLPSIVTLCHYFCNF